MPAKTITFDTVVVSQLVLSRDPGANAVLHVAYQVSAAGQFPVSRVIIPALTAPQQTQLNALWDAVATKAQNAEGL